MPENHPYQRIVIAGAGAIGNYIGVQLHEAGFRVTFLGTPRVVNRLLRRVRDYAQIHGDGHVDAQTADRALAALEIDEQGLDGTDRKLLAAIIQKFGSGPVGVQALAAVLAEEPETVEDVYEPFLLRLGFLDRTPQGRIATEGARTHLARLGFEIPAPRRAEAEQSALWENGGSNS